MLEMLIRPKQAEKKPWKMFFIGLIYASLSILIVYWLFSSDPALSKASGILVVTFCVMFSMPYMYFMLKREEKEDEHIMGFLGVLRTHKDAVYAFMWLFLGFIIAFSFWHIVLGDTSLFNIQIETYCMINSPGNVESCVNQYDFTGSVTANIGSNEARFLAILENNVYVMIFTLLFSLIFGAGAIFILAWNASVISAAVSIFTNYKASEIPLGILRYMIHGFPEIAAYFIAALAGGILGVGVIRNGVYNRRFLRIIENVIILIFIAIIVLVVAAAIEVYITPIIIN